MRTFSIPYAHHHKPLLIRSRLGYKPYIRTEFSEKNLLKNKEMVFGNGVKNIQAAAYNGARTVDCISQTFSFFIFQVTMMVKDIFVTNVQLNMPQ